MYIAPLVESHLSGLSLIVYPVMIFFQDVFHLAGNIRPGVNIFYIKLSSE